MHRSRMSQHVRYPYHSAVFFEKRGATWMLTHAFLYSSLQLALMYVQYSKGLDAVQTAFAVKKYKSHRPVGLPSDIIASMRAQQADVEQVQVSRIRCGTRKGEEEGSQSV